MDPITGGFLLAGLALKGGSAIAGIFSGQSASDISQQEAQQEQKINQAKQTAVETQARRAQMENLRNLQRARAQATNAAVNQGANFGTGLAGGLAQTTDQAGFNMSGINNSLETSRGIFQANSQISNLKQQMASVQGDQATEAGLGSLGGALMTSGTTIGNLSQSFGSLNLGGSFMGGGSPSGYGRG